MASKSLIALLTLFFIIQTSSVAITFILILPNGEEVTGNVENLVDITLQHYPEFFEDEELGGYIEQQIEQTFEEASQIKFDVDNLDTSAGLHQFEEDMKASKILTFLQEVYLKGGMELTFSIDKKR